MSDIQPIQTFYKNIKFRSRLEARWAVFFDAMQIEWKYETQGYEIKNKDGKVAWRYLPDFYLTESKTWIEVKGDLSKLNHEMYACIMEQSQLPHLENSHGTSRGIVILSDVPEPAKVEGYKITDHGLVVHAIMQSFEKAGEQVYRANTIWFGSPYDGRIYCIPSDLYEFGWWYVNNTPIPERICHALTIQELFEIYITPPGREMYMAYLDQLVAYRKARQARFEHGETPT